MSGGDVVTLYYRADKASDAPPLVAELRGDPFEICNRVAERLGVAPAPGPDLAFERVMAERRRLAEKAKADS